MENLENKAENLEAMAGKTMHRRTLLKAGWILPVIAVTPLVNTASAMSTVDCDALLQKREMHRRNHDRAAFDDIQGKLDAAGCPC